jgi:hypothetical protein
MSRIRTIKPEFFTSEDIVSLPPLARILYIALWCEADKEGRMAWKPQTFKMRYLPADDCDIEALCNALITRGLIVKYEDQYAYIPRFKEHQHINPREKSSTLPDPITTRGPRVTTRQSRDSDDESTRREEGKGREGDNDASDAALTPTKKFDIRAELKSCGVDDRVAEDWIKHRKTKGASVTETVLKAHISEAGKASLPLGKALAYACVAGWQGFRADWYFNREG